MKNLCLLLIILCSLVLASGNTFAQWRALYATWDDDVNGTGNMTPSVGVIGNNSFVTLVTRYSSTGVNLMNFMIPYVNADSGLGRVYTYGYGNTVLANLYQTWTDGGFDQVTLLNAKKLVVTPDSMIYVANNDVDHNILVFKFDGDTIQVVPTTPGGSVYPRQQTGTNQLFALAVDGNGYVYACNDTSIDVTDDIKIYPPLAQWTASHMDSPVRTIDLPNGVYKGIITTPDGGSLFVSDYGNRRIMKYTGSPATGYTLVPGFTFQLGAADTIPGSAQIPSVVGLGYLPSKNILFVACHVWGLYTGFSATYGYGRAYLLDPGTGDLISSDSSVSMIDFAAWNRLHCGESLFRGNDGRTPGIAAGYTSNFDLGFDENGDLYTACLYGWSIEKWHYEGTLPTVTDVRTVDRETPGAFLLAQNYPNPFNPKTRIEFALTEAGFVTLTVHDVLGREITTLVREALTPGSYSVDFHAEALASGVYLCRLQQGGSARSISMVLAK